MKAQRSCPRRLGLLAVGTFLMVWYWYSSPARDTATGEAGSTASGKRVALQVGSGSVARLGAHSRAAGCPIPYQQLTVEQVAAGARPYLHGAGPSPCRNCNRTELWAHFCQFKSHGPICPSHVRQGILEAWAKRGYTLPLTLTPCDLWRHLEGRTLLLMGDSQMLDFYKASFCFMSEFWDALDQEPLTANASLVEALSDSNVEPTCVRLAAGVGSSTRICYVRQDKGETFHGHALPLLLKQRLISRHDLLVVNFGLHHGKEEEYRATLSDFAAYYQKHQPRLPRLLWQQTPTQHFKGRLGGEYGGGKPPFECGPIEGYALEGDGRIVMEAGREDDANILRGGWRNAAADPIMRAAGIPIVYSFNESLPMWDAHRENSDGRECTHYCFPSAPEAWVAQMYRALRDSEPAAEQG